MIITITIMFCDSRLKYRNCHNDHNHRNDHNEIITYWFVALTGGVCALFVAHLPEKNTSANVVNQGILCGNCYIPESLASIARMVHFLFKPSFRHVLSASSLDMVLYLSLSIKTCVSLQMKRWNGETVKQWNGETVKRWNGETVKRRNGETVHSVYSSHSPSSF